MNGYNNLPKSSKYNWKRFIASWPVEINNYIAESRNNTKANNETVFWSFLCFKHILLISKQVKNLYKWTSIIRLPGRRARFVAPWWRVWFGVLHLVYSIHNTIFPVSRNCNTSYPWYYTISGSIITNQSSLCLFYITPRELHFLFATAGTINTSNYLKYLTLQYLSLPQYSVSSPLHFLINYHNLCSNAPFHRH